MNNFSKFFLKIIFLLIVLNTFMILDHFNVFNLNEIKNELYYHINFVKVLDELEGDYLKTNIFDEDITVSNNISLVNVDGKMHLINNSEEVIALKKGNVIKIEKEDDTFTIYVQTIDDEIYVYSKIKENKVQIYELININDIIGITDNYDDGYYCILEIKSNNNTYED